MRGWTIAASGIGALIGGMLGWSVTVVGCRPDTCYLAAGVVGLLAATVAAAGVGLVMILVARSLDEWREAEQAGQESPGVGCEVPDESRDSETN